jgi:DDE superfamily endonuclease
MCPKNWIKDPDRCRLAGIPERVGVATKPALATQMLARTLDAGVPAAWVTGDEVYGADPDLRAELERRGIGSVLAVACDHRVVAAGHTWRADALLARVPARAWQLVSDGRGANGHRWYDWAFICLDCDPSPGGQAGQRWLLARRNHTTGELAFYRCLTPRPVALATLVRVAGRRWTIEERSPDRQGPLWSGSASGPSPALLVPLDHPGHGRPRRPGGARGHPPSPAPATFRADQLDLQRGPAPARDAAHPARRGPQPSAGLVGLATPTSSPRPHLPLPPTRQPTMKLTSMAGD